MMNIWLTAHSAKSSCFLLVGTFRVSLQFVVAKYTGLPETSRD